MIVKDKIYINTNELGNNVGDFCKEFTYKNPEYAEKKRQKFSVKNTPEFIYHYRIDNMMGNQMLILPRGGLKRVLLLCERLGISPTIIDRRISHNSIDCSLVDTVLDSNQNKIVNVLYKNEGGLIEAAPGCITGDTEIRLHRTGIGKSLKIKTAYKHFNQLGNAYHNWDLNFPTYIRSYNGNTIQLYEIEDIVYSGKKNVYRLELDNGLFIKATKDHKIMTKTGWIELKKLKIGKSEIMCDKLHSSKKEVPSLRKKTKAKEISGLKYHKYARIKIEKKGSITKRAEVHRLLYEAYINKLDFNDFINTIKNDKKGSKLLKFIDPFKYHIHHKDRNPFNNDISNLECLLEKDHCLLHSIENKFNFNQGIPHYSKVKKISFCGIEDTYDIVCKEPHHNFVANGMVVHNSGKSIAILDLISKVKQPTLIMVHEHRLSKQWTGEIEKRLFGTYSLGELNGEKKKDGDIVLGIINTVYIMFQENPEYFNKFGMVVIDETHRCSAPMFHLVINNLPAKYRVGVTGTVERRDGKHILIYDTLGEKLIDIEAKDAKHRITSFDYRIINTNIRFEIPTTMRWTGQKREQTLDITRCISQLTEDRDRNNLIVSEVTRTIEAGYYPLVLSDRIDHNKKINEHLVSLGYKTVLLIGETRKSTRWEEIRQDTSIQCIVGNTKIASEALDLPRLSALFLTCPSSNLPQIKQRLGRIRRFVEGKPLPIVFDICDNLAHYPDSNGLPVYLLKILTAKRIRFYKELIKEYDEDGGIESVV